MAVLSKFIDDLFYHVLYHRIKNFKMTILHHYIYCGVIMFLIFTDLKYAAAWVRINFPVIRKVMPKKVTNK